MSTYAERLQASGNAVDQATLDALNRQYGFDLPLYRQYLRWFVNFLKFDLGRSFEWRKTVAQLLRERVPISVAISLFSLLVTYAIAVPVGIYSATHQYSLGDYLFTGIGFVGLATPNFFLALILMFLAFKVFGVSVIGLFSPQFLDAPWSMAKFLDMLKHLPVPIIVIGTAGTAGLIRVMRGCLLDELQKQYVITARSKGLQERRLLFKYPGAGVDQPGGEHGRLEPDLHHLRRDHHQHRVVAADRGAAAVRGAAVTGHVPGGQHHHGARPADLRRHADLRHPAGGGGSAHPLREERSRMTRTAAISGAEVTTDDERQFIASQWQIMYRKLRRHRLAMVGLTVLAGLYFVALFCEFFAVADPYKRYPQYMYAPPQRIRFVDHEGTFHLRPFVYAYTRHINPKTLLMTYTDDPSRRYPLQLFARTDPYKLWGLFESDLHLLGVSDDGVLLLLGSDRLGRDFFSRMMYGLRISVSIGLVGVAITFVLGCTMGGISGYFGGTADVVVQRIIEFLMAIPTIPFWMALSAALPQFWPALRVYFFITLILSVISWTGLARVVRGKLISTREEDFVMAAVIAGASSEAVIARHLLPSFLSYIIVNLTLSIPGMILGETALSFLGLGLRPPVISLGVLLKEAQDLNIIALYPWLLLPGLFVIIFVISFNFMGDGLRDAADPYR